MSLEKYFKKYRQNTIGYNYLFNTCYGRKKLYYFDWTASGRLYKPIEDKIKRDIAPYIGNTHSESSDTGTRMTKAYSHARKIIKNHVNAKKDDILITCGSGMTGVINKLQRMMGLKIHENFEEKITIKKEDRPVVFITHMEHHSNQISWLETICDVICIAPNKDGYVEPKNLEYAIKKYKNRKYIIGSFTACSNVTGILTPYHEMARILHENDGICLVDFSACAPYINIDMNPKNSLKKLDGIFFSPHKFLGGPGSCGVGIFNSNILSNKIPDNPGGGTVKWTNPWGGHRYVDDIEYREDGGTPPFLQTIRAAMAIKLKENMNVEKIINREKEIKEILFKELKNISGLTILDENVSNRIGIVSFNIDNIHYNLIVKILNDKFGIQTRGGCSCAGTYGHYLLNIGKRSSKIITNKIDEGDYSQKPGWVRISIHPIIKNKDVYYLINSIKEIAKNIKEWSKDYKYNPKINEYTNIVSPQNNSYLKKWFEI